MSNPVIPLQAPNKFLSFLKTLSYITIVLGFIALIVILAGPTTFYSVGPDEDAVVLRLGKYHRTEGPGLHFKLPFNFEEVIKLPVRNILNLEFGFRTVRAGVHTQFDEQNSYLKESMMLTGDLNVAEIEWIVQYQISDAKNYLYSVVNVDANLFDISLAVMKEVVGDHSVNEILTTGRNEIETEAQKRMQEILDSYKMGISLVTLKIQDVNPPEMVKASFDEANSAKQEAEKIVNESWEEYNKVIIQAKGKTSQSIADAQAYKADVVNRALGDSQRFLAFYEEYKKAPEVTRKRLYFDKLKTILTNAKNVYIVDPSVKSVVPLLNLATTESNTESKAKGAAK